MRKYLLVILLCLGYGSFAQHQYWVSFTDKGPEAEKLLERPQDFLSDNVLQRRYLFDLRITESDLPIYTNYTEQLLALDFKLLRISKWLNSVLVENNNSASLSQLNDLSFVKEVIPITTLKNEKSVNKLASEVIGIQCVDGDPIYGCAFDAINMLKGQFLHQNGFQANTIDIGVMDNGFLNVDSNRFFDSLNLQNKIRGVYNFVDDTTDVFSIGDHGAYVMSTLGANIKDTLLGTAPLGNYFLFTTEDNNNEGLPEEINWAMAAEWAEQNMGNWIVLTTSLGYSNGYGDQATNHTYEDMDGNSTIITRAADLAAQKGLLVVNSAGNEGESNWKYVTAPADGDSVLAIGAVDRDGNAAVFSSFGPSFDGRVKPNVSALGRSVAVSDNNGRLSTISGTSFSCPILAGLAACLWEAYPSKSNMEIVEAIEQSAHLYYNPNDQLGYGIPNFEKAFEILSLDPLKKEEGLIVYPNPVFDELNIFFAGKQQLPYQFIISDVGGKVWVEDESKDGSLEEPILISELPSGVYAVFVKQGKEKYHAKFIKR